MTFLTNHFWLYQNMKHLVGEPFTKCREGVLKGNHGKVWSSNYTYAEDTCLMYNLYSELCNECKCYPSYVEQMTGYNIRYNIDCSKVLNNLICIQ